MLFLISDGLGRLSDGQTGPDDYQDRNGFQWVRKKFLFFVL